MLSPTTTAQRAQYVAGLRSRMDAAFASPGFQDALADLRARCRASRAQHYTTGPSDQFDEALIREETGRDVVRNIFA